tara:strand:- start:4040 stop:5458 length:1419 start_codon:yes stop_codon:yes gene_type:complete
MRKKKKKILIIFNETLYFRNFLLNGSFKDIERKYICNYIVDNKINLKIVKNILGTKIYKKFKKKLVYSFEYTNKQRNLYTYFFSKKQYNKKHIFPNIKLYFHRLKSFKIFYEYDKPTIILGIKRFILWIINLLKIFSFTFLDFKLFDRVITRYILAKSNLINFLKKYKPDLIIIPFSGSHISIFDVIEHYKKLGEKKVFLITENWDNLYSRYLINHPDYIGIWGDKMRVQLRKQNFNGKSLVLGAPRLKKYFDYRNQNLKKIFNFKYIVFFDNTVPKKIDNEIFLNNFESLIERNKKTLGNYKLVFRPHPFTYIKNLELIDFKNYRHIILDPQMKDRYTHNLLDSKISKDDFMYSVKLIKNAEFIIASTSSVILEASILYKKVCIYSPKKNSHLKNQKLIDLREHIKTVMNFPNISICDDEKKLESYVHKNLLRKNSNFKKKEVDKFRKKLLFSDNTTFEKRLSKKISNILN